MAVADLHGLLESTLHGLGYELVDVERSGRGRLIRVFMDKPDGIGVEDCAAVSNHLTRLLAVEGIDYDRLEVSSPGLDRPLTKMADFIRFSGEPVKLKLRMAVEGRRNFSGTLRGVDNGTLQLEVDGKLLSLELSNLGKVRLIPKL
ncbi:ribosome maturation factor RimP [Nitrosovibrio sp. Nv17]|uniref:ribosome maturation factor RimP n=1 Tax=Nitrosovibrio sp. Nv17 TaxID=1855339 RepID=UPI000908E0D0|nr:ribosome maturation factor RimP [Nitrosovibrio sp. Nv17]SFW32094.1 ribosome maturation factor RimP [Nitrosovibrio sp. Nv17]